MNELKNSFLLDIFFGEESYNITAFIPFKIIRFQYFFVTVVSKGLMASTINHLSPT